MDDGEADRTVTFLDGDRVAEGAQRVLRRRVTGKTGERQEGGHAADGDDVAVALCAKSPECRERAGERAHEVGRDRSLVARDRYISGESGLDDSRVVHDHVEDAEPRRALVQRRLPTVLRRDVELDADRARSEP